MKFDMTLVKGREILTVFIGYYRPLLNQALFFEAASTIMKTD